MPPVRSVVCSPDDVVIETAGLGTIHITRAMIPANVINKPVATIEAWFQTRLDTTLIVSGIQQFFAAVHIFQVNPTLIFTVTCSNDPISGTWWL